MAVSSLLNFFGFPLSGLYSFDSLVLFNLLSWSVQLINSTSHKSQIRTNKDNLNKTIGAVARHRIKSKIRAVLN